MIKDGPVTVVMAASEMSPFAKEGGLGDVVYALSRRLSSWGHDVRVVLPCYASIDRERYGLRLLATMDVPMGVLGRIPCRVMEGSVPASDARAYFIRYDPYYARRHLYGHDGKGFTDNDRRYALLSRATLELVRVLGLNPDIFHAHDWQTAVVPVFMNTLYRDDPFIGNSASLLTIHNMLHQGVFDKSLMDVLEIGWRHFHYRELEFFDRVNLLKGGIYHATLINTVSPTYVSEIQRPEFAYGIDGVLRDRRFDLYGILNGVDYDEWNPEKDPLIAANFSRDDLSGKHLCKGDLQQAVGLPRRPDVPLLGLVSRLVKQKGIDILAEASHRILSLDVQIVLLGSGEPWSHFFFEELARDHPKKFACRIGFDNVMAHKIMAGSDFFLLPSRFEPCGLTQMYSLRYGTLPIVRATGGLNDTVENFDGATLEGTGFKFYDLTAGALFNTIGWAVHTYHHNRQAMENLIRHAMGKRFAWEESARKYESLYRLALERRGGVI
ncbi:MAG: glycogen synthase GlgA [Syntrophales bacterium]